MPVSAPGRTFRGTPVGRIPGAVHVLAVALVLAACRTSAPSVSDTPDAAASPQASAIPAPLANALTAPSAMPAVSPEGGPAPVPLSIDVALPPDALGRDTVAGYTLSAVLRQGDLVGPPRSPEVSAAGLEAARRKTELRLAIDLFASRMRLGIVGGGFVLPADTELRARADRYGHVVVAPGGLAYRVLPAGALRALFGERRFDVAPLSPAEVVPRDDGGKRIGIRTRKVDVATRAAKATFEVGRLADLGDGGVLLCRVLLDLMSAPPGAAVCTTDELPVRAELRWTARGSLAFELTGVLRKPDLGAANLAVPPTGASLTSTPLPGATMDVLLSPQDLAALRTVPVDVPVGPLANPDGMLVTNATDELRFVHVDGVPVAWLAPGAKGLVKGLQRGRYVVQWRTFMGDAIEAPSTQTVPGSTQVGEPAVR